MESLEGNWKEFFESGFYAEGWNFRIDSKRTFEEVEGVLKLLNPPPGAHILDWCGGWGRHSLEFARRGFRVTLLDFARNHLELAREQAELAGLSLELVCADFRHTPSSIKADFAVNLFTAGIGYLTEEDDVLALKSLYAALKPGATFLLDTMNLFWLVKHYQSRGWEHDESGTKRLLEEREFDFWTNRNRSLTFLWKVEGGEMVRKTDHRIYSPAELAVILRRAGFKPFQLFGDFDGRPFDFDSRRIVMISRR